MMTFQVWKLPNTWAHAPTGLMGFGDLARSIRFQGTGACCSLRCDQVCVCACGMTGSTSVEERKVGLF